MLLRHIMSIAPQLITIYNTTVHKNSIFALNVNTCWCYDETPTCHKSRVSTKHAANKKLNTLKLQTDWTNRVIKNWRSNIKFHSNCHNWQLNKSYLPKISSFSKTTFFCKSIVYFVIKKGIFWYFCSMVQIAFIGVHN